MRKLLILLMILGLSPGVFAGEDQGLAGAAYVRGFTKDASGSVDQTVSFSDTGILEIATGSLAALSFRFRSDTNTGIYSGAADDFRVVTGGSERFRTSSAGTAFSTNISYISGAGYYYISNSAVSNTTPTFSWGSNSNTGLGRNAVGEPSMVASGVESMRWTASQTLVASGSVGRPTYSFIGNQGAGINGYITDYLVFMTASATRGYFNNNGVLVLNQNCDIQLNNTGAGGARIVSVAATNATPTYAFNNNTNSGLGRNAVGEPSMVASGTEAMRFTNLGCYLASTTAPASDTAVLSRLEITSLIAAGGSTSRYDTTGPSPATTTFNPGFTWTAGSIEVYVGGVLQVPTTDYSEASPVVTFGSTVASGSRVTIMRR